MKRRELLAEVAVGATTALAGCAFDEDCVGETWPTSSFHIDLDRISFDEAANAWRGHVTLSVSLSLARSPDFGYPDAEVGVYSREGRLLDRLSIGDMTMGAFPEENKSTSDCGDLQHGSYSQGSDFVIGEFPRYFALWTDRAVKTHGRQIALEHTGNDSSRTVPPLDAWERVDQTTPFPPVELDEATPDGYVTEVTLQSWHRECDRGEPAFDSDAHCCDRSAEYSVQLPSPSHLVALKRVRGDASKKHVTIEMQVTDYQRPPPADCDRPFFTYSVGFSTGDSAGAPKTVTLVHRNREGDVIKSVEETLS